MTTARRRLTTALAATVALTTAGCATNGLASLPLPKPGLSRGSGYTITAVFERHGACTIDTPVFELKDTLTGKCVTPPTPNLSTAFRY